MVSHLTGLLTAPKGLPSSANKVLQEDKEAVFGTMDTLRLELPLAAGIIYTLKMSDVCMAASLDDAMLATDLVACLERKGIPFRQSHHLFGLAVRRAETLGVSLSKLDLREYQVIQSALDADLYAVLDFRRSVAMRSVEGGTALAAVRPEIKRTRTLLDRRGLCHK